MIVHLQERRQSHARAGPAPFVHVARSQAMQDARSGLPILGLEQEIMEAVNANDVILLCGETGSGKTTQVCFSDASFVLHHKQICISAQDLGSVQAMHAHAILGLGAIAWKPMSVCYLPSRV